MAFVKRTWLARIGTGLNKFIIGEKDANNKQTLTNSPDYVSQQGDVISADNLNDLEDRIAAGFNEKQDTLTFDNAPVSGSNNPVKSGGIYNAMSGLRLTKVWENPSPSSDFIAQVITIDEVVNEAVITYRLDKSEEIEIAMHVITHGGQQEEFTLCENRFVPSLSVLVPNYLFLRSRRAYFRNLSEGVSITFSDAYMCSMRPTPEYEPFSFHVENSNLVPVAIYKVGNIYNS